MITKRKCLFKKNNHFHLFLRSFLVLKKYIIHIYIYIYYYIFSYFCISPIYCNGLSICLVMFVIDSLVHVLPAQAFFPSILSLLFFAIVYFSTHVAAKETHRPRPPTSVSCHVIEIVRFQLIILFPCDQGRFKRN